jgi:flagellar biosynthetic protein FliR
MDLAALTVNQIFIIAIVFSRIGAILMVMPGIGDAMVTMRVRLIFSLGVSLLIAPVLSNMPILPESILLTASVLIFELLIGIFIGLLARTMQMAIQISGAILATLSGLGSAMLFDPSQNTQGVAVGAFLSTLAVTLLFSADLHHILIRGFVDSYEIFPAGKAINLSDALTSFMEHIRRIFLLAIQLTAPQIILSTVLLIAAGVLSRLMPSLHIFYLITPIQLLLSFGVLMITLSAIMLFYLEHFKNYAFIGG